VVALVLAQVSAVVGIVAWEDEDYSVDEVWDYSKKGLWGDEKLTYWLRYVEPDGTVIAFERGPTSWNDTRYSYVAIDPDGSLRWRSHTNAMPGLTQGANGDYYLVDWQELANRSDTSGARWCNLTAIDRDSGYKWSYLVDNGSLGILTTDLQGTVFVQHFQFHAAMGTSDEIMSVSSDGQLLWRMAHPCPNMTCSFPVVEEDGSLRAVLQNQTSSYDLIIDKDGQSYRLEERERIYKHRWMSGSEWDGKWFEVREEPIDYDVCEVSVYAFDIDTGEMVWKTLLRETVNDEHNQPNSGYMISSTYVDGSGTIYCGDMVGERYYALDADGDVLWSREGSVSILADYRGGLLVVQDNRLMKWDSNGNAVWSKEIGDSVDLFVSRVVVLEDGTIYLSTYDGIVAYQPRYDGQSYTSVLQWVIALDVVFLTGVAAMGWRTVRK
jgi:outer membrane protein assembly factor BamB